MALKTKVNFLLLLLTTLILSATRTVRVTNKFIFPSGFASPYWGYFCLRIDRKETEMEHNRAEWLVLKVFWPFMELCQSTWQHRNNCHVHKLQWLPCVFWVSQTSEKMLLWMFYCGSRRLSMLTVCTLYYKHNCYLYSEFSVTLD